MGIAMIGGIAVIHRWSIRDIMGIGLWTAMVIRFRLRMCRDSISIPIHYGTIVLIGSIGGNTITQRCIVLIVQLSSFRVWTISVDRMS